MTPDFHAAYKAHVKNILALGRLYFPLKESPVREAVAKGFGFNTEAALIACLKTNPQALTTNFNQDAFLIRFFELEPSSAEAVATLLEGVALSVTVDLRHSGIYESVYHIVAFATGLDKQVLATEPVFVLPAFTIPGKETPYQVDSAPNYRVDGKHVVTRYPEGRGLMTAKLTDGRWGGEFFIYDLKHRQNDESCIRSVKAAMARAILPALTNKVRCWIWQPDGYTFGAWRVHVELGPAIRDLVGKSPVLFEIPKLLNRQWKIQPAYLHGSAGMIVDSRWEADLYTNTASETENPTTIGKVKAALYSAIFASVDATRQFGG